MNTETVPVVRVYLTEETAYLGILMLWLWWSSLIQQKKLPKF
jgi:hypothetical protein